MGVRVRGVFSQEVLLEEKQHEEHRWWYATEENKAPLSRPVPVCKEVVCKRFCWHLISSIGSPRWEPFRFGFRSCKRGKSSKIRFLLVCSWKSSRYDLLRQLFRQEASSKTGDHNKMEQEEPAAETEKKAPSWDGGPNIMLQRETEVSCRAKPWTSQRKHELLLFFQARTRRPVRGCDRPDSARNAPRRRNLSMNKVPAQVQEHPLLLLQETQEVLRLRKEYAATRDPFGEKRSLFF